MNLRPFLVDDDIRHKIASIVTYAEQNPFTIDQMLDRMNGDIKPPGDMDEYTCIIPYGNRVVFSIEIIGDVKRRHLTMSVNEDGKLPSIVAVEETIKLFGFENELMNCKLGFEDISPVRKAISVMEKIN